MRCLSILFLLTLAAGCSTPSSLEPSLAPRPAEAIDPRVPVAGDIQPGTLDPALAARLSALVAEVRSAVPAFDAQAAAADRLSASAGPAASESWIAAELALSRLIEQYGVTTRAAAEIDALAAQRLERQRWIVPADREAIAAAAEEVSSISDRQSAAIDRLKGRLAR